MGDLPCDGDGVCMVCKTKPSENESLICKTCITPWHVNCLSSSPDSMADAVNWCCPDCCMDHSVKPNAAGSSNGDLIAAVHAINSDPSLTDQEKNKRRQELLSGGLIEEVAERVNLDNNDVLKILDGSLNCSICMQLPERPVTTPCGHNFCLKCFQKWIGQRKSTCANCRTPIPAKMASQPRINSALVIAIRMARTLRSGTSSGTSKVAHFIHNQNRPDKAFTTERAKKTGKANACSGKIFVTIPGDHFGPISADNDPERNLGVLVGETWEDRFECRQWGAHFPHVAGIAGQSDYGAQSVALSGGYEDDEDHGEWFLYTGSGGRDLSGNKRTNKLQSFDQKFDKLNEALRVSCLKGYPVRVVRSHKEKRSSYAPDKGVRYDGVYRIEKCWRKAGKQGFKVCRYLFVRCDNEPAPWTSDDHGDRPRALPTIKELNGVTDMTERKGAPAWDYDEEKCCWMWKKAPPPSRKPVQSQNEDGTKVRKVRPKKLMSVKQTLLKEFSCLLCREVMDHPLTTPCAHNFCKACLEGAFAGQSFTRQRTCEGRRTLRAQKNIMKCPSCPTDISDFLQNPQINRELMNVIESLKRQIAEENAALSDDVADGGLDGNDEVLAEEAAGTESVEDDKEGAQPVNETEIKQTHKRKRSSDSLDNPDVVHNLEEVDSAIPEVAVC
ncbi:E3 ubiquitin-protein ligase ORTHRUS 2-like [Lycium ferocissimum]|uniref:E3 ubiquitin-protein ligase ORTHRUS 2-like n=1 Tax=Lycium ferocissimum TaxID=112874 RepID=UPI0028150E29|nr:E3 ubiquitin-protein ligase ORTHRUS 2-like [Lycium ferocissimum]